MGRNRKIFSGQTGAIDPALLVALVNTVALLVALGFVYYIKFIHKKPQITEAGERMRIEVEATKIPAVSAATSPGHYFEIKAFTVNIASPDPNKGLQYVTIALSLEARDSTALAKAEEARAVITDKIIYQLGKKTYEQLTEVQGRFILRSEIAEFANQAMGEPIITNVYITQITAQ